MSNNFFSIDSYFKSFQRFGVNLGLERILTLLADLGNPHQSIPIIHVGGTNGKGSVCAYLSSILTEASYKVGRYTSPHLVDWTERICINNQGISESRLKTILLEIKNLINSYSEVPTQFEVITAAAWVYFAQEKVDIAVVEVGLGGRLDATNVCHNPLVSVITSISREHWQYLGDTLGEIATEKAGILKRGCSAVIGQVPDEAATIFEEHIETLNCPAIWVKPAIKSQNNWAIYQDIEYPLPLLGKMQLSNSALAIATIKILQQKGWNIGLSAIQNGMAKTRWSGRLQWIKWQSHSILIDGTHNQAAAEMLRDYVNTWGKSITWIIGILATKEHDKILEILLTAGDKLYLVPVSNYDSANPETLAEMAISICPNLVEVKTFPDVFLGLKEAIKNPEDRLIVLCGSLYLVGNFLRNLCQ
ncbi:MAG: folylpolyglutamate synthase/dihydrofolate synthase family protein [Cyanobacteria bacterium P01_G01_bin.49]